MHIKIVLDNTKIEWQSICDWRLRILHCCENTRQASPIFFQLHPSPQNPCWKSSKVSLNCPVGIAGYISRVPNSTTNWIPLEILEFQFISTSTSTQPSPVKGMFSHINQIASLLASQVNLLLLGIKKWSIPKKEDLFSETISDKEIFEQMDPKCAKASNM